MDDIDSDAKLRLIREWTIRFRSSLLDGGVTDRITKSYIIVPDIRNYSSRAVFPLLTIASTREEYVDQIYDRV